MSEQTRSWPEAVFWLDEIDPDLQERPADVVLSALAAAAIDPDIQGITEQSFRICDETKRLFVGGMAVRHMVEGTWGYRFKVGARAVDYIIHRAIFGTEASMLELGTLTNEPQVVAA